ncbi:type VI secretion system baseplate subunit TssG [Tropicimonas sp.]|uniref:type VI secretion system baseplate subunit TssG n=1 Tax=Tropicimonas sp. TaxID=2067044 RepID=UPI003A86E656
MASRDGPGPDHLSHLARLEAAPEDVHVFLAMRIVEAHFADAPRLGDARRPSADPVRIGQQPGLAFPPATLAGYRPPRQDRPGVLSNRFFGFFGPNGPLPLHLTEYARERLANERDSTLVGFADMLTHRLATLLYRAWTTGQPAPSLDRGEDSAMGSRVAAIAGRHGRALDRRDAMPDLSKRYFTGHLGGGPRSPEVLVAMVSAFFRAPVHLREFVGCWLELEPGDRSHLGAMAGLGQGASIGSRVWSRAARFRLVIGPLPLDGYNRLLPGGDALRRLTDIVRNFVGDALDWDVNLVLRGDAVPAAVLGGDTRLGLTSWICGAAGRAEVGDLYLEPERV